MPQQSARILRSLATAIATAQVNTSTATTAIGAQTRQLRLASTLSLWFATGTSTVTAAAGDSYLPANTIDYITVTPGQTFAFLSTTTATGYISISECE